MRRKLAAGNWKMNGTTISLTEAENLAKAYTSPSVDLLICPPSTLLSRLSETLGNSPIATGGQDCHAATSGAHTGDVSAEMLKDSGATYVILGHSERRDTYDEESEEVRAKAGTAMENGLTAVVCLGESLAQREANNTLDIIGGQLAGSVPDGATGENLVIAYEPVWAIGTGLVPTLEQIAEVHGFIRERLIRRFGEETGNAIRILYGGSVKAANATEIFSVADVDGALVGGASLKASDFSGIIDALEKA
ncbi:triose-phosphate isomerase [Halocynthiibacter styelae]|uniref:Triosephosphate isomerase n=1 Tax=Halocynthiibacter styelae TaxID=2761955 RepID=A0A8J7IXU7_9RHOB|nr:triose-phosphate isomerase [Paenihalocynthiibacter styelae]MBI1494853.1 triose-phosphate isomerase [Paenihalocynthiibacter styelae]